MVVGGLTLHRARRILAARLTGSLIHVRPRFLLVTCGPCAHPQVVGLREIRTWFDRLTEGVQELERRQVSNTKRQQFDTC